MVSVKYYRVITLRVHLVGGDIGRIENRGEKSGKKIDFIGVWLERKGGWKIGGAYVFSLMAYQNSICSICEENRERRNSCIND